MKFFVVGDNNKAVDKLSMELSNYYKIDCFNIIDNNIDDINKIVRENKEWIIWSLSISNIDVICNLAETIIFLNFSKESIFKNDFLQKHIRKGIIIKNKRQLKKYLKSVYESDRYNF